MEVEGGKEETGDLGGGGGVWGLWKGRRAAPCMAREIG
jgi:hypothetical protein